MSTITAPAPGTGNRPTSRTPFVIAGALLGVVAAGVVVAPHLGTSTGTPAVTTTTVNEHDAVEHRADDARASALAAAAAAKAMADQQAKDLQGEIGTRSAAAIETMPQSALPPGTRRAYVGSQMQIVPLPEIVVRSTTAEQTGTIGHHPYVPQHVVRRYVGSVLVTTVVPNLPPDAVTDPTVREQVGGAQPGYPYLPEIAGSPARQSDGRVPTSDDAASVPFFKARYFHPASTTPPTHEYR